MKSENAIEVRDLTKKFKVYYDKGNQLKERLLFRSRNRYEERWVLKGISFEVKKGEAIGLIGHNGCGKSTTLKLLSRIIYPDSGTIEMRGRVSSLIELGAGFHPDMSGRENIYINAAIFGLTKKEIDARVDDIIAFSELEEFIDNPVRTYSSGMYMRLAFSVAINVDADILLIDEILAVGDANFQAKCFNKLREIKKRGTTIVLVSHSLSQIEQMCDKSIWIREGCVCEAGLPRVVDPHYLEYMSERKETADSNSKATAQKLLMSEDEETILQEKRKRWGSGEAHITKVMVLNSDGVEKKEFSNRESISICIEYETQKDIDDVVVGVAIYRDDQTYIYGTNTLIDYAESIKLRAKGRIMVEFACFPLNAGKYTIDLALHRSDGFDYDFWREVCEVVIKNKTNEVGIVSLQHKWEIINEVVTN